MIIRGCNCRWSTWREAIETCDICIAEKKLDQAMHNAHKNIIGHGFNEPSKIVGKMSFLYDGTEYTGDVIAPEFNKPKKPKPLTIKRAVKFLRKHPEVESIKLTEYNWSDNIDYKDAKITFDYETVYREESMNGRSNVLSFKVRSTCTIKLIKDIK